MPSNKGGGCGGCGCLVILAIVGVCWYTGAFSDIDVGEVGIDLGSGGSGDAGGGSPSGGPSVVPETLTLGDFTFVVIKPGSFAMGSTEDEIGYSDNEMRRMVIMPNSYGISIHEITASQYWSVTDPSHDISVADRQKPVAEISWDEAVEFCEKLERTLSGRRFRLPYETEWEFACRAAEDRLFSVCKGGADWRRDLDEALGAWRSGDQRRLERWAKGAMNFDSSGPVDVRSFPANPWGLHEMHGNVWEWCQTGPDDVSDAPSLRHRPIRGGAWVSTTYLDCRSARRAWQRKDSATSAIGFRVVLENP